MCTEIGKGPLFCRRLGPQSSAWVFKTKHSANTSTKCMTFPGSLHTARERKALRNAQAPAGLGASSLDLTLSPCYLISFLQPHYKVSYDAHFRDETTEAWECAKVAQLDLNMSSPKVWALLGCRTNTQREGRRPRLVRPCWAWYRPQGEH